MSFNDKYFLVGGAGFIGSHFVDHLLKNQSTQAVTVYDNFSSGQEWHLEDHREDARLKIVRGEVGDLLFLTKAMAGHDVVIHLASNPNIAAAVTDPDIDFREGTVLTRNVCEAMRLTQAKRILYCSGSGVYGEKGDHEFDEDHGPLIPISTYGASKLAGEALISSYSFMFNISGLIFRFGNVVGPRQTHGVGYDFTRRLMKDPSQLTILGNGEQSKSYVYVGDVVAAVMGAHQSIEKTYEAFNVATGDYITVNEIARIALRCLGLSPDKTRFLYTGGDRGWKGDVPVIRLKTDRIRKTGWKNQKTSAEAVATAIEAIIPEIKSGRIQ